ncbi:extracellular solute-binding protein [Salipiger sp.]|uniref:extracellular solute-binding protein n=1 Tax=Salipiger sp. TaxID=2078585 RepID=UPI003A96DD5F
MRFPSAKAWVRAGLASTFVVAVQIPAATAQTLHVMGPGGAVEDRYREYVIPGFETEYGVSVVYDAVSGTDIIAKLEAQKENPQYDVVYLVETNVTLAEDLGLCAPLEPDPVFDELLPAAHVSKFSTGSTITYNAIVIRTDIFEQRGLPEPDSWLDLGKPEYEGELVLLPPAASATGMSTLIMISRALGGGESDVTPGLKYIAEKVRPNLVTIASSASKVQEMLQTGEVGIAIISSPRFAKLIADGLPVKAIRPKEGAPTVMTTVCAVAGAPNPELAQKYVQHDVSTDAQKGFLPGDNPVNRNAELPEAEVFSGTGELIALDWARINADRDAWIEIWNREIE